MIIDTLSKYDVLDAIVILAAKEFPECIDGDIAASYNNDGGIDIHFYPIDRIRGKTTDCIIFDDVQDI